MIQMTKRQKLYSGVGVVIAIGLLYGVFGWMMESGNPPYPITAVEVDSVRYGSVVQRVTGIGTLVPNQSVVIRAEVTGKINKLHFQGGEMVEAGTPLVEIDNRVYQAELKDAEARLTVAKSEFARSSKLVEKSAGPVKARDKALAELQISEATYEKAKINMENTVIRAPFEGQVAIREVSVGSFIDARAELVQIVDITPMKIDFKIAGLYLQNLSRGQKIEVAVDGFDKPFMATIESIDPKVDPVAHSVAVRASMPNDKGVLKPGLFVQINLVVGAKDQALLVPESAVLSSGDESFVYRVVEGSLLGQPQDISVKTPVIVGISEQGNIEIVKGLSPDDRVITVGQNKVGNGTPIRVVEDAEAEDSNGQGKEGEEEEDDS